MRLKFLPFCVLGGAKKSSSSLASILENSIFSLVLWTAKDWNSNQGDFFEGRKTCCAFLFYETWMDGATLGCAIGTSEVRLIVIEYER